MKTASYSILAKVRSRYGRMLTSDDYAALSACSTIDEFAAYLYGKRDYAEAMSEVVGTEISRGRLELLLRESEFRDNITMCSSQQDFGRTLSDFFVGREEASFLLNILRGISAPGENPYIIALPRAFYRYTRINFDTLRAARNYSEFLDAIRDSRYYPVLKQYRITAENELNYTELEAAIYRRLYSELFDAANSISPEVKKLISTMTELDNISVLYRAKKYFGDSGEISNIILPYWDKIDTKTAASLCSGNLKNFTDVIANTVYRNLFIGETVSPGTHLDIETESRRILHDRCVRTLHFTMDAAAAALSYVLLKSIELRNLIIIIECIRYNAGAKSANRLLVY